MVMEILLLAYKIWHNPSRKRSLSLRRGKNARNCAVTYRVKLKVFENEVLILFDWRMDFVYAVHKLFLQIDYTAYICKRRISYITLAVSVGIGFYQPFFSRLHACLDISFMQLVFCLEDVILHELLPYSKAEYIITKCMNFLSFSLHLQYCLFVILDCAHFIHFLPTGLAMAFIQ